MNKAIKILLIADLALMAFIAGTFRPQVVVTDDRAIEAICSYSRTVVSGEWEEACALAQDVSGIKADAVKYNQPLNRSR